MKVTEFSKDDIIIENKDKECGCECGCLNSDEKKEESKIENLNN